MHRGIHVDQITAYLVISKGLISWHQHLVSQTSAPVKGKPIYVFFHKTCLKQSE